ncbi:MAG: hypothetical protein H8D23_30905, partial [Candidatus Brocadiales bacterium]|nr:hypothetical protein [Candidatus Brocadiales bacterium]
MIYFGARYMDPDTGTFINQDSYLGETGKPPSLHRYLYAFANPTFWVDPTGHFNEETDWFNYLPYREGGSFIGNYVNRPIMNTVRYVDNIAAYVASSPVTFHQKVLKPTATKRKNISLEEAAGDFDAIPGGFILAAPAKVSKLNKI